MKSFDLWPYGADEDFILAQSEIIAESFKRWLGRHLVPPGLSREETALAMMKAPFVIASTDASPDPVLNYGNRTALSLWELDWGLFTQTLGRQTAEPLEQEARQKFLEEVKQNGFVDHYAGIRISSTGRRFQIHRAIVWNLFDEEESFYGQAVMFKEWDYL